MNSTEAKRKKVYYGHLFYRLTKVAESYNKEYATIQDVIKDIDNFSDNYYSLYYWLHLKLENIVERPFYENKAEYGEYRYPSWSYKEEIEEIVHEAFIRTFMGFHQLIKTHDIETVAHLQNRIAATIRYLAQNEINRTLQRFKKIVPLLLPEWVKPRITNFVNNEVKAGELKPQIDSKKKERKVRQIQLPENEEFNEDKIILDTMIDEYLKQCSKMEELIFLNMVKKADYNYAKHQGKLLTEQKIAELSGVCYTTVRNRKQKVKREFKDFWTGKKTSQQVG